MLVGFMLGQELRLVIVPGLVPLLEVLLVVPVPVLRESLYQPGLCEALPTVRGEDGGGANNRTRGQFRSEQGVAWLAW